MNDQQSVKDYIQKYKLEEELSVAVNMAIKGNSDDPYLIIAEHMKSLSHTEEEEEEDDDDVMMEEEEQMPVLKKRGRRDQVMAAKVDIPSDWSPPVYEKEAADMEFLKDAMLKNKLMKNLTPSDRDSLLKALKKTDFDSGAVIIKQGDPGDFFYIISDGEADITVNGNVVMKAVKGIAFGELALLHNAPRAATVTATTKVVCFALDMMTFKAILMGKAQKDAESYMSFISAIDLLKPLSEEDKKTMCAALREKEFPADRTIVCEGDAGDYFYIVRDGEVKCTKVGQKEEVSRRLTRGDFFGELALLKKDTRQATVTCVQPTTVLMIDRSAFTRVLGPLSVLLEENAKVQGRAY